MRRPRPWLRRVAALLLPVLLTGCFSLMDVSRSGPRPYGGVQRWFDGGWETMLWFTVVCPLVDLPLCAVFDTLALPLTIPFSLMGGSSRPEEPPAKQNLSASAQRRPAVTPATGSERGRGPSLLDLQAGSSQAR